MLSARFQITSEFLTVEKATRLTRKEPCILLRWFDVIINDYTMQSVYIPGSYTLFKGKIRPL